jgi:hypothetical protein
MDAIQLVTCIAWAAGLPLALFVLWLRSIPREVVFQPATQSLKALQWIGIVAITASAILNLLRLLPSESVMLWTIPLLVSTLANAWHAVKTRAKVTGSDFLPGG